MSNRLLLYGKGNANYKKGLFDLVCPNCGRNNTILDISFYENVETTCGSFGIIVSCEHCYYYETFEKENHGKWIE